MCCNGSQQIPSVADKKRGVAKQPQTSELSLLIRQQSSCLCLHGCFFCHVFQRSHWSRASAALFAFPSSRFWKLAARDAVYARMNAIRRELRYSHGFFQRSVSIKVIGEWYRSHLACCSVSANDGACFTLRHTPLRVTFLTPHFARLQWVELRLFRACQSPRAIVLLQERPLRQIIVPDPQPADATFNNITKSRTASVLSSHPARNHGYRARRSRCEAPHEAVQQLPTSRGAGEGAFN